jgi:hypothetical protein
MNECRSAENANMRERNSSLIPVTCGEPDGSGDCAPSAHLSKNGNVEL